MKNLFLLFLFVTFSVVAQKNTKNVIDQDTSKVVKAPIDLYKIYTLHKDTTYVDTSLTIQSEYKYNLL